MLFMMGWEKESDQIAILKFAIGEFQDSICAVHVGLGGGSGATGFFDAGCWGAREIYLRRCRLQVS